MERFTSKAIAVATISLLTCLSAACTTMQPVTVDPTGSQIRSEVQAGDTVRVLTQDGHSETLRVTAVGDTALVGTVAGASTEVSYQIIQGLEVRRTNSVKTTWLTIGALAVVVLGAEAVSAGEHPKVGI